MKKFYFLIASFLLIFLAGINGCVKIKKGPPDGGVFKSENKGDSWVQKTFLVPVMGTKGGNIANLNVKEIVVDPQDPKTLYLASEGGMFISYNRGETWWQVISLPNLRIESIAIDPKSHCFIYATLQNKIYKSTDCGRSWENTYLDARANVLVNKIVVDFYNNAILYAGLSTGDLLKSTDFGQSWFVIKRFENNLKEILLDPNDSRILYIATQRKGLFKSVDSGTNWIDLNQGLKEFSGAFEFKALAYDKTRKNTLILASRYGLLKTEDGGQNWRALNLLTPPRSTEIYSLVINPQNGQEIFYSTANLIYKTENGGLNWQTLKIPTSRTPVSLRIDPQNPNLLFMGVRAIKK